MSIGKTIAAQIGKKALFMIGAKNLIDTGKGLSFKVMRNAKAISYVRITLNAMDTYDVEYLGRTGKVKANDNGLYWDMLRNSIETNTELYTSL
jgi:hypothetical protein